LAKKIAIDLVANNLKCEEIIELLYFPKIGCQFRDIAGGGEGASDKGFRIPNKICWHLFFGRLRRWHLFF
jgi:hypothetical protein